MRLGDIAQIFGGGTPSTENQEYWDSGNIPWITLADLPEIDIITNVTNSKRKITEAGLKNSSAKILPIDTILVSSRATIGRIAITKTIVCTNQGFINIVVKNNNIILKFVALSLRNMQDYLKNLASKTTFPEISKSNFKNVEIPIPPLETQKEIISKFDEEIAYIKQTEKIIANQKEKVTKIISRLWQDN